MNLSQDESTIILPAIVVTDQPTRAEVVIMGVLF
jgi:hypothetical protein